jgi:hypothetical protein
MSKRSQLIRRELLLEPYVMIVKRGHLTGLDGR